MALPSDVQEAVDAVVAGNDLPKLGSSQDSDLVFDDGEWRVWAVRGAADYGMAPAQIEHRPLREDGRWGFVPIDES